MQESCSRTVCCVHVSNVVSPLLLSVSDLTMNLKWSKMKQSKHVKTMLWTGIFIKAILLPTRAATNDYFHFRPFDPLINLSIN